MNISTLVAFVVALITKLHATTATDPFPVDVLKRTLPFASSSRSFMLVNKKWNEATKASCEQKFDELMAPLLRKMETERLNSSETRRFKFIYADLIHTGYVQLVSRVPKIITFDKILEPLLRKMVTGELNQHERRQFQIIYVDLVRNGSIELLSQVPRIIRAQLLRYRCKYYKFDMSSVKVKLQKIVQYWPIKGFGSVPWITRHNWPLSFEMLALYIAEAEWKRLDSYLIFYDFFWRASPSISENIFKPIFWNALTASFDIPVKGHAPTASFDIPVNARYDKDACDWYNRELEALPRWEQYYKHPDDLPNWKEFYYLRTVWCSHRIRIDNEAYHEHTFVTKTRAIFVDVVSFYISHLKFDKLKQFVEDLNWRGLLFLLQSRTNKALIPYLDAPYNSEEWTMIWDCLVPLLKSIMPRHVELHDVTTKRFVDMTWRWQRRDFVKMQHGWTRRKVKTSSSDFEDSDYSAQGIIMVNKFNSFGENTLFDYHAIQELFEKYYFFAGQYM